MTHFSTTPIPSILQTRRRFLTQSGCGFGWLAYQSMLQADLPRRAMADIDPLRPLEARVPSFEPRAKAVIFLFMVGGPSQIDTFDYKPLLDELDGKPVPSSLRKTVETTRFSNVFHGCEDKILRSPFSFKQHGDTGTWVSDLMPHFARHVDDVCFLHSLQAESNNHAPASYQLHTGDVRAGKASIGSWVTYGLGSENENLPGYVVLFDAGPLGGAANYSNGFLPPAFQSTRFRDSGNLVADLLPPAEFAQGQRPSLDLLAQLNQWHRESYPGMLELDARIATYELAYRMQFAATDAGRLEDEPKHIHQLYGVEHEDKRTQSFARKCLLARRLVERGVRFVQLYDMPDKDGWDAHDRLLENHQPRARWTDQPVAGLLEDLKQSGLLASTLVVWASEFGRTPMVQGKNGRQHNAAGFTIWMAGGGIKPGLHVGVTDEIGLMATERPIPFRDLHATILTALGISYEDLSFSVNGRDERLTGVSGSARPLMDILI